MLGEVIIFIVLMTVSCFATMAGINGVFDWPLLDDYAKAKTAFTLIFGLGLGLMLITNTFSGIYDALDCEEEDER